MGKLRSLLFVSSILIVPPAFSAPILDQSFTPEDHPNFLAGFGYNPNSGVTTDHFQSFTAGLNGTLTGIDLLFSSFGQPTGDLTLSIYEGGHMEGAFLGSTTVSGGYAGPSDFISFDISDSNIQVEAGKQFGFVVATSQEWTFPDHYFLQGDAVNGTYDGGFGGTIRNGALTLDYEKDFYFRSHVEVASVPEPSSVGLLGLSIIGLIFCRRKSLGM